MVPKEWILLTLAFIWLFYCNHDVWFWVKVLKNCWVDLNGGWVSAQNRPHSFLESRNRFRTFFSHCEIYRDLHVCGSLIKNNALILMKEIRSLWVAGIWVWLNIKGQYWASAQVCAIMSAVLVINIIFLLHINPFFQVERTDVSLSDPQAPVVRGTRFSGNSFYQFPSDSLPVNTDFTGKKACLDTCRYVCVCVSENQQHVSGLLCTACTCTHAWVWWYVFVLFSLLVTFF